MKKPYIRMNCKDVNCGDCVLSAGLCGTFQGIVDRLNIVVSEIAKKPEEPKPHPQVNRGDKVQVSDDRIAWRNRYFERIREDGMITATQAMEDSFSGFSGAVSTAYRYCWPYNDE